MNYEFHNIESGQRKNHGIYLYSISFARPNRLVRRIWAVHVPSIVLRLDALLPRYLVWISRLAYLQEGSKSRNV